MARLIIAPAQRGQGLGVTLVRLLLEEAGRIAYPLAFLRVFPLNRVAGQNFRASREKSYKTTLEALQAGREDRLDAFRRGLQPMRLALDHHPYIAGPQPGYADYLAFGAFMWARTSSPFELLAEDDVVHAWRERCLDLYDGAGRRETAA